MYVWQEQRKAIPCERSLSNSNGKAGGGPRTDGTERELGAISGSWVLDGVGFKEVTWLRRVSNFCWVCSSRVCNSERACSRDVIHLSSMVSNNAVSGDCFPKMLKEESCAEKYMDCDKSVLGVLGLWNANMVNFKWVGLVLCGRSFSNIRATVA